MSTTTRTYHPTHDFVADEFGVDIWAFEAGQYCNGPRCRRCGGWCHHHEPTRAAEPCPAAADTARFDPSAKNATVEDAES